jgi:hypothetical protein
MHELSPYLIFTDRFNRAGLRYAVGGGVAAMVYGEPRLTLDLDLLLELSIKQIDRLLGEFPDFEFYVPPADAIQIEVARGHRGHMNVYHHSSGLRADIYLASRDPLDAWSLDNVVRVDVDGGMLALAPPEAVIIRKLEYFREGGSEKHVRDIRTILSMQEPLAHRPLMEKWIVERGLQDVWRQVMEDPGA